MEVIFLAIFALSCGVVHVGPVNTTANESTYFLSWSCAMDGQFAKGCAKRLNNVHSSGKCALLCNMNDTCVGFSIDQNDNSCVHHKDCPKVNQICRQPSTRYKYYNKKCYNNGRWIEKENKCQCPTFMIGDMCENIPKSCAHIVSLGEFKKWIEQSNNKYMEFILDPDGNGNLIQVHCETAKGAYIVLRNNGFRSFNNTWQEYKYGFGSFDTDYYWIGLETMHRVMKFMPPTFKLVTTLRLDFKPTQFVYRMHSGPNLSNEANGYKISFKRSNFFGGGDLRYKHLNVFGDCLGYVKNIPFSTWDRDNDSESIRNCASEVGSGWWFSDCNAKCNIFGFYPTFPASHPPNQELRVKGVDKSMYKRYKSSNPESDSFVYGRAYLGSS